MGNADVSHLGVVGADGCVWHNVNVAVLNFHSRHMWPFIMCTHWSWVWVFGGLQYPYPYPYPCLPAPKPAPKPMGTLKPMGTPIPMMITTHTNHGGLIGQQRPTGQLVLSQMQVISALQSTHHPWWALNLQPTCLTTPSHPHSPFTQHPSPPSLLQTVMWHLVHLPLQHACPLCLTHPP